MTQEGLVIVGQKAGMLLDFPAFDELFSFIVDTTSKAIVETAPKDHELRKQLYYTVRGMNDFVGTLKAYRASADEIIAKLDSENNPSDDQDDS